MLKTSDTFFFNHLFGKLNQHQLCYAYSGGFTDSLTQHLLSLAEAGLDAESESTSTKKKVYFIMVESLQNITQHQGDTELHSKDSFFCIDKYKGDFQITSGNMVENVHIAKLKLKLEKVNGLDAAQLKSYSREILSEGSFSDKGGAGLGLIEIARKSGSKLAFDFVPHEVGFSYFYFQSNIANKSDFSDTSAFDEEGEKLTIAKDIHKAIIDNNLKLFYHGQFGHENLKSLLKMTEGSTFENESVSFKKTAISLMIELLQNICFHGVSKNNEATEKPGLFMVSDNKDYCSLLSGNYIKNSSIAKITAHIHKVNEMDAAELDKLFLEVLLKDNHEHDRGAGLGFIDIRIKTGNKIEIAISQFSDELSFLIIKTNVTYS